MLAKFLKLTTSSAHGGDPVPDPMQKFLQNMKDGRYRRLPPDKLAELKSDIAAESELYYEEDSAYPPDLLVRALYNLNLDYRTCFIAADVIARAVAEKDKENGKTPSLCQDDSFMKIPEGIEDELPFLTDEDDARLRSLTPQEIYDHLSRDVYGQDEAKKALAMLVHGFAHGRASSLLLAGPTGSGKSQLIESMKKLPGVSVSVINSANLAPDGYRSSAKIQDAFPPGGDAHKIVIFEEFDKATEKHQGPGGTNYTQLLLNSFLVLLEHKPITFSANGPKDETYTVDTSKTSFILIGAWENLMSSLGEKSKSIGFGAGVKEHHDFGNTTLTPEDYIKYGVRREIVGRITDFAYLSPITVNDFRRILDEPELSPITKVAKEYRVKVTVSDALKDILAQQAFASGLGCRSVYSELKRRLNHEMFRDCTRSEYFLDTADSITDYGTRSPAQAPALAAADAGHY